MTIEKNSLGQALGALGKLPEGLQEAPGRVPEASTQGACERQRGGPGGGAETVDTI